MSRKFSELHRAYHFGIVLTVKFLYFLLILFCESFRVLDIMSEQRYIESKFSIDARSHTKNLNYRTKIRRMFYDLESGRITCHVTH